MRNSQEVELKITEDINNLIEDLDNVKKLYKKILDEYSQKMSNVDSKQQDILHYVEFKNVNSVAGFRILKELQKVRRERRGVEDILELLNNIKQLFTLTNTITAKNILNNKIDAMKKRKYKERVYSESELDSIANLPEYIEKESE